MKKVLVAILFSAIAAVGYSTPVAYSSVGFYTNTIESGQPSFDANNTSVIFQAHPGYNNVDLLSLDVVGVSIPAASIVPGFGFGTGEFKNIAATEKLDVNLITDSISPNGASRSISGRWTYASGVGSYAGQAGNGTWAATFQPALDQLVLTSFSGDLHPTPEPASMAILGMGAVGFLARRRRK